MQLIFQLCHKTGKSTLPKHQLCGMVHEVVYVATYNLHHCPFKYANLSGKITTTAQ